MNKFLAISFLLVLAGCNYNRVKDGSAGGGSGASVKGMSLDLATNMNYASVQKLVLQPRCMSCHSNAGGNKGNLNLETYDALTGKLNKIAYRVLEVKDMPTGGLPAGEYELFEAWINAGAPMNNTGRTAGEIRGALNWPRVSKLILSSSCLDCHVKPNPDGGLDLTDYQVFKDNQAKIFDRLFVKQDMPPKPYPAMGMGEKNALLKWMAQGIPQ